MCTVQKLGNSNKLVSKKVADQYHLPTQERPFNFNS
uniref:Uncharacterized protein n=1 Tax=Anguilla anguilla TaxID=7936 RepID=A0A0E9VB33_ANGAN